MKMDISVFGLGKLGLCTAACFASIGKKVIGYDKNEKLLNKLGERECYIQEPGLEDAFHATTQNGNLIFCRNPYDAIMYTNRTYIIVPTPSNSSGRFINDYIFEVLEHMVKPLKEKNDFHIVNIVSTVMPGSCEKFIKYLETETGKKCGEDFGLTYNPEFIAIGTVMRDFQNPDMVLIGSSDEKSAEVIEDDYFKFCGRFNHMSLISAEITKLCLNYFLALKISYVNDLASICEHIPGSNIDHITTAIGSDSRVGHALMKAGLGFSGPCLPRDNVAFGMFAKTYSYSSELSSATIAINENVINRIVKKVISHADPRKHVDIFGMSYKAGTSLTEGSQSILLKNELEKLEFLVRTFDNPIMYEKEGLKIPGAIIMMSDSMAFNPSQISDRNILLIDPWRRYIEYRNKFIYYGMGVF